MKALYYPFSRCVNSNVLKRLIILFDELLFIDPAPRALRQNLMRGAHLPTGIAAEWERVRDDYSRLVEARAIRLIDPVDDLAKYDRPIAGALEADISDDEIWSAWLNVTDPVGESAGGTLIWYMLKERITPSVLDILSPSMAPGYFGFIRSQAEFASGHRAANVVWSDKFPTHILPKSLKSRGNPDQFFTEATPREIFELIFKRLSTDTEMSAQIDLFRGEHKADSSGYVFAVGLPYVTGSALALNQALVLSDECEASLITDSAFHHEMLKAKYRRVATDTPRRAEIDLRQIAQSGDSLNKASQVTLALMRSVVSDDDIDRLTVEQCLKYRREAAPSLGRFRILVDSLVADIQQSAWDVNFETEVRKLISKKIAPEALSLRDQLHEIKVKLFGSLASTGATVTAPSLLATIYPELKSNIALLVGSAAVAGGSISAVSKDLLDTLATRRQARRNGLTYLIDLNRKGRSATHLRAPGLSE